MATIEDPVSPQDVAPSEENPTPQKLDPKEASRLQAMFGNPKAQAAKYCLNEKGKKEVFADGAFMPQATVVFKNCEDCEYIVDTMCTKVLIESCHNTKIVLNQKIVTSTVDIYKMITSAYM